MTNTFICIFGAMLVCEIGGTRIEWTPCKGVVQRCTVHSVDVTPCDNPERCTVTSGQRSQVTVDFTPHFSARRLRSKAEAYKWWSWWQIDGVDTNACAYTNCPTQAWQSQIFTQGQIIPTKYSTGKYRTRSSIYNVDDPDEQCCAEILIKLTR